MQRINRRIQNPLFLLLFLGTPLVCIAILAAVWGTPSEGAPLLSAAGAALYLLGPFGMTVAFNVPLNNRLDRCQPHEAEEEWPRYRASWQRWNHARTTSGVFAMILLAAGGVL